MVHELAFIDNFDLIYNRTVILYGAGNQDRELVSRLEQKGISVSYVCDSNVKKWGGDIRGAKIISPATLKQQDEIEEVMIIINTKVSTFVEQIIDKLNSLSLRTDCVVTLFGFFQALAHHEEEGAESLLKKWHRIENNYNATMQWRWNHLSAGLLVANNILVYQPGKVGSQTICNSLVNSGHTESFFSGHLHTLNYPNMEAGVKEVIRQKLETLHATGPIKIITLVREPISRDLAFVFEVMGTVFEEKLPPSEAIPFVDRCSRLVDKIAREGDMLFGRPSNRYGFQFEWFDHEIKEVFGIDIFAYPFDQEQGYTIIRQENAEVLAIKMEKLSSLENVIGEFLETDDFKLINYNEGETKPYRYLYPEIKRAIKISPATVSLYYDNNSRMDHFYTKAEQDIFLQKWKDNLLS